jgi:hypothetical protein
MNIETGIPKVPGDYVVYSKYATYPNAPFSMLVVWTGELWHYHGSVNGTFKHEVLGWIGPLPKFTPVEYDL